MGRQVFSNRNFKIYSAKGGYVIHNTLKEFNEGHTHVTNFKTAKYLTHLAIRKEIPKHLSKYLALSLIRISTDTAYKNIIIDLFLKSK